MTEVVRSTEWLPCPFCGAAAVEAMWPKRRGCSDPTCGAHMANLPMEQWNRRADATPEVARLRADNERLMHHVRASPSLANAYVQLAEREIAAQRAACEKLREKARNKPHGNEIAVLPGRLGHAPWCLHRIDVERLQGLPPRSCNCGATLKSAVEFLP